MGGIGYVCQFSVFRFNGRGGMGSQISDYGFKKIFSETALVGGSGGGVALPNLFAASVGREKESLCFGCPAVALGIEPLPREASSLDRRKAFDPACLGAMPAMCEAAWGGCGDG